MNPMWLIDLYLEDRYMPEHKSLVSAIRRSGSGLITHEYVPHSITSGLVLPDGLTNVIAWGTIGFGRQIRREFPHLRPGGFWESDAFSTRVCRERYGDLMMNLDPIAEFPMAEIEDHVPALAEKYKRIFVRPDDVGKTFSGSVTGDEDHRYPYRHFLGYVKSMADPTRNPTVYVFPYREILGEYRFVCGPNGIIASSQYRYERKLDVRIDIHPDAQAFANTFINSHEGPDSVYVMDVCVESIENSDSTLTSIVEFNNFSNSGLYACDRDAVVQEINRLVGE